MKFQGRLGYVSNITEERPGVFTESITEIEISGDLLRNAQSWTDNAKVNSNFVISNRFSFVCPSTLRSRLDKLRFVLYEGVKWKISSAELNYPRVTISVSGVFNE